jgi:ABC-type dipeptide/oligopeptide/nickel transport system permease component
MSDGRAQGAAAACRACCALPNALVPTLNITAINLGYLVGGVVIVEKVYSYPGFGR